MSETIVNTESVRVPGIRDKYGILSSLGASIRDEGMRHPIVLWTDGTLLSGSRRYRAVQLLGGHQIQAMFVNTLEDAAKALHADLDDDYQALPMKWSEVCRLWAVLRRLDAPAHLLRKDANRRQGVALRRLTVDGDRDPGRGGARSEDYPLSVMSAPYGVSHSTAKRLWAIYSRAWDGAITDRPTADQVAARAALAAIDDGESSITANYVKLTTGRSAPISKPKVAAPIPPAAAARQLAAWDRSLPQLEGIVAGLVELGTPNPDLTPEQIAPARERLASIRRDIEKMIKSMRENKS